MSTSADGCEGYEEEERPCPLCGAKKIRREFQGREIRYRICSVCGSAWATEMLAFEAHYREYFPEFLQKDNPALEPRYDAVLRRLADLAPSLSLLEIGCGNGQFLDQARRRGWAVCGTELSLAQVEHCRRRGLEVEAGDLKAQGLFSARRFGAIVLIEVLEHLPDPVGMLREAAARALPGGVLYLTTPHWGSLSRRLLGAKWSVLDPEHVVLATVEGLKRALQRGGWRPISLRTRNFNPVELLHSWKGRAGCSEMGQADQMTPAGGRAATKAEATEAFRRKLQGSFVLRAGKDLANVVLRWTTLGDTLVALARRA